MTGIFHDASIGNAIHVILVRLILLQGEEVILSLSGFISFALQVKTVNLQWNKQMHINEAFLIRRNRDIKKTEHSPSVDPTKASSFKTQAP